MRQLGRFWIAVTLIFCPSTTIESPSTSTSLGKRPCTGIEAQEMGVRLDQPEVVHGDHLDVLVPDLTMARRILRPMRPNLLIATFTVMYALRDCVRSTWSATASAVMPKCL